MKKLLTILLVSLSSAAFSLLTAEESDLLTPAWSINFEKKSAKRIQESPDGSIMYVLSEIDDGYIIEFYETTSGKLLWDMALTELPDIGVSFNRILLDGAALLCTGNEIIFAESKSGKVLKKIPLLCETWDDIENVVELSGGKNSGANFLQQNDMGILGSENGLQIIDYTNKSVIYSSNVDAETIVAIQYGDIMQIKLRNGGWSVLEDSIYFFDASKKEMIHKGIMKDLIYNDRLYLPWYNYKNTFILALAESVLFIDLDSKKIVSTEIMNPNEPDNLSFHIINDELCMLATTETEHKLFDGKGKIKWEIPRSEVPGVFEGIYNINNRYIGLHYDNEESKACICSINPENGKILWNVPIFEYEGYFQTGHQKESLGMTFLKATAATVASAALSRAMSTRYYRPVYDAIAAAYYQKSSEAFAKIIQSDDNSVTVACYGNLQSLTDGGETYKETLLKVDLEKGNILSENDVKLFSGGDFESVIDKLEVVYLKDAVAIIGYWNVYILSGGKLETLKFNSESINLLSQTDDEFVIFTYNSDDDIYDYYKIDVSSHKLTLLARSESPRNFVDTDYFSFKNSYIINDDGFFAFKPISAAYPLPTRGFSSPPENNSADWNMLWDKLDIGDIEISDCEKEIYEIQKKNPNYYFPYYVAGISVRNDNIIFMGEDGLAYAKQDGSCNWSKEWSPECEETAWGVSRIGNWLVYSTGDDTKLIKNDCEGATLASYNFNYDDILISAINEKVIVSNFKIIDYYIGK